MSDLGPQVMDLQRRLAELEARLGAAIDLDAVGESTLVTHWHDAGTSEHVFEFNLPVSEGHLSSSAIRISDALSGTFDLFVYQQQKPFSHYLYPVLYSDKRVCHNLAAAAGSQYRGIVSALAADWPNPVALHLASVTIAGGSDATITQASKDTVVAQWSRFDVCPLAWGYDAGSGKTHVYLEYCMERTDYVAVRTSFLTHQTAAVGPSGTQVIEIDIESGAAEVVPTNPLGLSGTTRTSGRIPVAVVRTDANGYLLEIWPVPYSLAAAVSLSASQSLSSWPIVTKYGIVQDP